MTATHLGGAVIDRPRTKNRTDLAGLLEPYRARRVPRPAPARRIPAADVAGAGWEGEAVVIRALVVAGTLCVLVVDIFLARAM